MEELRFSMRFCPVCRTALQKGTVVGREVQKCPSCGYVNWENPAPVATGVLVMRRGVVLVKAKTRGDLWGLPSGFVEWDESAEDAFVREIKEETNIDARVTGTLGTYPIDNGRKRILLLAFEARGREGKLAMDGEVSEVAEFDPETALGLLSQSEEKRILGRWVRMTRVRRKARRQRKRN